MTQNACGMPSWFELPVVNLVDAMSFYEGLFGWRFVRTSSPAEPDYMMIQAGALLVGGLRKVGANEGPREGLSAPVVYFAVEALGAKIDRARELGAKPVGERVDLGAERGSYQRLLDREGNMIALWAPR